MIETTNIEITVKQLDSLILNYYKKYFNDENITLERSISSDSYHDDMVFTKIKRKDKVGEYPAKKEYAIGYQEIKNIINQDLEQYGYKILNFYYNNQNKKVYNINVSVEKLEKVKQKTL